jgi:hypothetical protein
MDNMGNSPTIGGKNKTEREQAITVETAPSVPLSSYEGVSPNGPGGGIALDGGFRVAVHDRELRGTGSGTGKHAAPNAAVTNPKKASIGQAVIPGGFESIKSGQFVGDGSNPSNVESKEMGDEIASKQSGEFKGTVSKRQK